MYNNLQVIKHAVKKLQSLSVIVRAACHPKSVDVSKQTGNASRSSAKTAWKGWKLTAF